MAYIYEVNGQQVEFDREPTDADIDEAAKSLGAASTPDFLKAPPEPAENIAAGIAGAARPLAQAYWEGPAKGGMRDAASMANILKQATPEAAAQLARSPLEVAKAYVQGHPWYGAATAMPGKAAGFAGRTLAGAVTAPENAVLMPYNMAAYEQAKIRENPTAPGLEYNPYAQVQRGQAATQGQAGAANQMRTVANQPFGNVNAQERAILEQDRMMRQNIRKKAYEKVMGPIAPGTF